MIEPVALNYQVFGKAGDNKTLPLLILHGLLGSGRNWYRIARQFSESRQVIVPDLRCHGLSPCGDIIDYDAFVADLTGLLESLGLPRVNLLGHSMGGKAAMHLALQQPDRVQKLVVADIAPVDYPDRHSALIDHLLSLPLGQFRSRDEVDHALAVMIPQAALRQFLLQNLARAENSNGYSWRINLALLRKSLPTISAFPRYTLPTNCQIPSLFIDAAESDYILPQHVSGIESFFSGSVIRTIPQAGHWVHVDQPALFFQIVDEFIGAD